MTATLKSRDELEHELAAATRRHQDSLAEIGTARLRGAASAKLVKAEAAAKADIDQLKAALAAHDRAAEAQAEQDAEQSASNRRRKLYEWGRDYAERLDHLAAAKAEVERAKDAVEQAFANCPRQELLSQGRERHDDPSTGRSYPGLDEAGIDIAIKRLPLPIYPHFFDFDWSPTTGAELAARFDALIVAERKGEGGSVAVTVSEAHRARKALRGAEQQGVAA